MKTKWLCGERVYPYGNSAKAIVLGYSDNGKVRVKFMEHCIAEFGWYNHLVFPEGYVLEIAPEQLREEPRR